MSTENQNGSATNNGIRTSIGGVGPNAAPRITSNTNSSLSYNCNSVLNRDLKSRQGGGPPTLPKYTSTFNSGSNGSGTGIGDIRHKDREIGGSYRLASLDRLALKQRILDGGTPNGDTTTSTSTSTTTTTTTNSSSVRIYIVFLFLLSNLINRLVLRFEKLHSQ